jgi:hypothetical protein
MALAVKVLTGRWVKLSNSCEATRVALENKACQSSGSGALLTIVAGTGAARGDITCRLIWPGCRRAGQFSAAGNVASVSSGVSAVSRIETYTEIRARRFAGSPVRPFGKAVQIAVMLGMYCSYAYASQ